ncbi:MAG: aminomethyl-transferring glycine dehydrogenase [Pseudohongiella sp.]|uniref:aminomethyl-transferring glycine dehydrogenase n=1 Tax=Pseudohongiella sp. TaxID=1979412 RepID=UPI0034A003B0
MSTILHFRNWHESRATSKRPSLTQLEHAGEFIRRHIGPDEFEQQQMLSQIGYDSLEALVNATVPANIRMARALSLTGPMTESAALEKLKSLVADDSLMRSFIGMGYYPSKTPGVIQRNVLENPGWYTAYTPYQPEISQGRLECLLNFQQMILDMTAMDIANASLLDEATAAAEGMALARRVATNRASNTFFVDKRCFPQTIDVVRTRARGFGIDIVVDDIGTMVEHDVFGVLLQYPGSMGQVTDPTSSIEAVHAQGGIAVVATDLLSLALLKPPGEMGADVVVGSSQRFGVPMGYGGPHAAFFAVRDAYKRAVPGRIIGVSVDSRGKVGLRMALQTREQHIRRERANSNICTSQVLLANVAVLYAMYHGPEGIRRIAERVHRLTSILAQGLIDSGLVPHNTTWFDTLTLHFDVRDGEAAMHRAKAAGINLRLDCPAGTQLGVSLDECTTTADVVRLWQVLLGDKASSLCVENLDAKIVAHGVSGGIPAETVRQSSYLQHAFFNSYHSETDMMRYLRRLEGRDIALNHSMIALGSCTMKLNAAAEMTPILWPEFSQPHPFVPLEQVSGYVAMIADLESMLAEITGFHTVSMQPNSGAQGEYAGLLTIRKYLDSIDQKQRDICLIPQSAHGTNPASAQMIGMQVVIVECDEDGNIDTGDLREKIAKFGPRVAALMLTYPSTHGVYEVSVKEVCQMVHACGGQVYMDGANMNAQVAITRPGDIGADVAHVNLHKTFCIPHGGGGPGMGPIGVKKHLVPFLPDHCVVSSGKSWIGNSAVSAAPWGSASILPISWMYISMMGEQGLLRATQVAILNANYIASRLSDQYPILYTGNKGLVAHECIVDLRALKESSGVSDEDVAKRLMDFGFHAPTMSFPVAGTLMIEPTESESLAELDRFIDAMLFIREEIAAIERGDMARDNNPLKNAPHTLADIMDEGWNKPYSKAQAVFPLPWLHENKYWPPVNRINNVHGDRVLLCSCPDTDVYR